MKVLACGVFRRRAMCVLAPVLEDFSTERDTFAQHGTTPRLCGRDCASAIWRRLKKTPHDYITLRFPIITHLQGQMSLSAITILRGCAVKSTEEHVFAQMLYFSMISPAGIISYNIKKAVSLLYIPLYTVVDIAEVIALNRLSVLKLLS